MAENEKFVDPRLKNLVKWKPGESGNPAGRAPRRLFASVLAEALAEPVDATDLQSKDKLRAIVDTLISKCIAGDSKCLTVFVQSVDPKRVQAAIRGGTVNILNQGVFGSESRTEAQELIDDFVGNTLPDLVAGLSDSEKGQALKAIAYRTGGISAQAGNAFFHKLMRSEVLPVVDQSRE